MDTFSALADPTRRTILEMLAGKGELSATDISEKFSSTPPAISQHLKVLREARLVRMEKRAQQRIYSINPEGITEMERWVNEMRRMWTERFDALDEYLKAEQSKRQKESNNE